MFTNKNTNTKPTLFSIGLLKNIGIILAIFFIAIFLGLTIGKGQINLLIVFIGALGGLALLSLSNELLFKIFIILNFFVVGQIMYFGGMQQAMLILYGIGLLLYLKVYEAVNILSSYESKSSVSTPLFVVVIFFILVVFISTLINQIDILQFLVGGKNLLFIWSLFFIAAFGLYSFKFIDGLWQKIYLLVLFQVPIVLYQAFYVAPKRKLMGIEGVSWDAIVGGFGGKPYAGGASGTLAYFLVVAFIYFLLMYRFNLLSLRRFLSYSLVILLIVILAEIKVIVILIPVGLAVIYYKQLFRHPIRLLLSSVALLLFFYMILASYEYQKRGDLEKSLNISSLMDRSFGYSFGVDVINYKTREMGRVTALNHWWQENGTNNLLYTLFGHGPGESRIKSKFSVGETAAKYPFKINRSAATQILWEVGILGFLLFLWLLLVATRLSYIASFNNCFSSSQKVNLQATSASLAMAVIMLPYGRDVIEVPILSFYIAFSIGYSAYAYKTHLSTRKGR